MGPKHTRCELKIGQQGQAQEEHRAVRLGQEEDHKDNQRAEESLL